MKVKPGDCKSLKERGRPDFSFKHGGRVQLSLGQIKEVGSGTQLQSSASSLLPAVSRLHPPLCLLSPPTLYSLLCLTESEELQAH